MEKSNMMLKYESETGRESTDEFPPIPLSIYYSLGYIKWLEERVELALWCEIKNVLEF